MLKLGPPVLQSGVTPTAAANPSALPGSSLGDPPSPPTTAALSTVVAGWENTPGFFQPWLLTAVWAVTTV